MDILCVYGSPRKGGNTDDMMDAFIEGVLEAGGTPKRVYLRDLEISPCLELYRCRNMGECAIKDAMTGLYEDLKTTHGIALATPVMFYSVSAMAKAFIDRCQAFWAVKYLLKKPLAPERKIRPLGVFLAGGGSKGQKLFDGLRMTFKYFLDAVDGEYFGEVCLREVDVRNDAKKQPEGLNEARLLGIRLTRTLREKLEAAK